MTLVHKYVNFSLIYLCFLGFFCCCWYFDIFYEERKNLLVNVNMSKHTGCHTLSASTFFSYFSIGWFTWWTTQRTWVVEKWLLIFQSGKLVRDHILVTALATPNGGSEPIFRRVGDLKDCINLPMHYTLPAKDLFCVESKQCIRGELVKKVKEKN